MTTSTTLTNLDTFHQNSIAVNKLLPDLISYLGTITPEPSTVATLQDAQTDLNTLTGQMQTLRDDLQAALDALALDSTTQNSLATWQNALGLFGISLHVGDGLNINTDWGFNNAIRAQNAFTAVQKIINKLAGNAPNDESRLQAILLFGDAFGKTELWLEAGSDPDDAKSAASTTLADRDGDNKAETPVIDLYLSVKDNNEQVIPNFVHNPENIVHEFGHVLVLRSGGDTSGIYEEWQSLFLGHISPFDTYEGWPGGESGSVFLSLANKSKINDLPSDQLENERIANMFQAFVFGYQPDLAGTQPDPRITSAKQRRTAWAMWCFMMGVCTPSDVHIDLNDMTYYPCGDGLPYWIESLAESLS